MILARPAGLEPATFGFVVRPRENQYQHRPAPGSNESCHDGRKIEQTVNFSDAAVSGREMPVIGQFYVSV